MKDLELEKKVTEVLRQMKEAAKKKGHNITFYLEIDGERYTS